MHKYPDLPNPYKYEKDKAKDYTKERIRKTVIKEPLRLYEKPPSPRPEYYENANKSTFEGEPKQTLAWQPPAAMIYVYPDGTTTTKPPPEFE